MLSEIVFQRISNNNLVTLPTLIEEEIKNFVANPTIEKVHSKEFQETLLHFMIYELINYKDYMFDALQKNIINWECSGIILGIFFLNFETVGAIKVLKQTFKFGLYEPERLRNLLSFRNSELDTQVKDFIYNHGFLRNVIECSKYVHLDRIVGKRLNFDR